MSKHKEVRFEEAIEQSLITQGGYQKGNPKTFDAGRALFPQDVIRFVQSSQPKLWRTLVDFHSDQAGEVLISGLCKELTAKGALHVLRHGFKCFGKLFRLAFFAPNSHMNPQAWEDYEKNILTITRQVHFSQKHPELSLDVVLSVNGLPIATMELKNPLTNQNSRARQTSV